MRIVLEVPENTVAAIFSYIYGNSLAVKTIDTKGLKEGNVIDCVVEDE